MNGILLVDKPSGMTSHDVVDRVRKAAGIRRVGHTGTLDPSATGLLVLCLGHATRLSEFLTGLEKVYEGDMRLGVITDSFDMDGEVVEEREVPSNIGSADIQDKFDQFVGQIMQVPPMVSAVKVKGERLYKKARKGETVEREPRPVIVNEFKLLNFNRPNVHFHLRCSRGTYARALCHDVGQELGCGAALVSLRRTRVGLYSIDNAIALDNLQTPEDVKAALKPMDTALDLPEVIVRPEAEPLVASGTQLQQMHFIRPTAAPEGWVQIKDQTGRLLALGEATSGVGGAEVQPRRVLRSRK